MNRPDDQRCTSEKFKIWLKEVFKRDHYKCQMPGCTGKAKLCGYRLKPYFKAPNMRFSVSNGITLCVVCRKKVIGREKEFESTFISLIATKSDGALDALMSRYAHKNNKNVPGPSG